MNRRDTIIVAVLVNVGLLIVLFATSLKKETRTVDEAGAIGTEVSMQNQPVVIAANPSMTNPAISTPIGDEVDQVIRQYTAPSLSTELTPSAVASESKPNFAEDLQAIGMPSPHGSAETISGKTLDSLVMEKAEPHLSEVRVKKGDMLEKIARSHRTTVDEIMKLNGLRNTKLKIGQVLKVPSKGAKVARGPTNQTLDERSPKYYTVKNGDNPWTIAVKNHLNVEQLLQLNNLDEEKARHLKPGDQLRIK